MSASDITKELRESFKDKEYAQAYAEDYLNAAIATQIKVLREDRGMTQAQLAELAGMKQSRISLMEDVNYGSWNIKTLMRLAAAFDVTLSVGFESFGKLIADVTNFSRETLHRPSREEELSRVEVPPSAAIANATSQTRIDEISINQSAAAAAFGTQARIFASAFAIGPGITHSALTVGEWGQRTPSPQSSAMGALQ